MKNIGIVCEGPTDYTVLKEVIDNITGEINSYVQLQPEQNLMGQYGNGWKGVWKWCVDNASIKEKLMKDIEPALDILVIQMDGDVSRKEKAAHCLCESTECEYKGIYNPIECDVKKAVRDLCPVRLPCASHEDSVNSYMEHLKCLIEKWLGDLSDTCIVIPCDSTEAWIVAAYDKTENVEKIEDPWINVISKKKDYHDIRISGTQKKRQVFRQFADVVCSNWKEVTELCASAKQFEDNIILLNNKKECDEGQSV